MNELSLHILDVVQNSIKAKATLVEIIIDENKIQDTYSITLTDNGYGMSEEMLAKVTDPFFTTRTTRDVGLGVSLFKMAAELSDGSFKISSKLNEGTIVEALFKRSHVNRVPLGAIEETIAILILNSIGTDIYYKHTIDGNNYTFDTREVKEILEDIPLTDLNVIMWIKNNIKDGLKTLKEEDQE